MNIHVPHQNDQKIPLHPVEIGRDNCGDCTQKICCTIFRIVDEKNQGRDITVIKSGGKTCDHLTENGECCIYKERIHHRGYAKSCHNFSCSGMGPILDKWIIENAIDIHSDSKELSSIFQEMIDIRNTGKKSLQEIENILKEEKKIDTLLTRIFEK